jgi:hypothetical protein
LNLRGFSGENSGVVQSACGLPKAKIQRRKFRRSSVRRRRSRLAEGENAEDNFASGLVSAVLTYASHLVPAAFPANFPPRFINAPLRPGAKGRGVRSAPSGQKFSRRTGSA